MTKSQNGNKVNIVYYPTDRRRRDILLARERPRDFMTSRC
jgi:hypothetical protein